MNINSTSSLPSLHSSIINNVTDLNSVISGYNVNITDAQGRTALHVAFEYKNEYAAKILLNRYIDIEKETISGKNSLHYACQYASFEAVKFLVEQAEKRLDSGSFLRYINQKTLQGVSALQLAAASHSKIFLLLLEKNATSNTISFDNSSPLHKLATYCDKINLVEEIVTAGAEVNIYTSQGHYSPLFFAASNNCSKIVDVLLKNKAEVNAKTEKNLTSLYEAASYGFQEVAKILLRNNANPNLADNEGTTPLHLAAKNNNQMVIQYLNENGANKEAVDKDRNTPLFFAENREAFELLLEKGANLYHEGFGGVKIAHIAAMKCNASIIDWLLEFEERLLTQHDDNYGTIMHYLAANNCFDIITELVRSHNFSLDFRDRLGFTPLHIAALNNHAFTADVLLKLGADPNAQNFLSLNTYEIAKHSNAKDVIHLLNSKENILKKSSESLYVRTKHAINYWFYHPLCTDGSDSEFITSAKAEILTEVGSAVLGSTKTILEAISKDYCKIYQLANNVALLRSIDNVKFSIDKCSSEFVDVTTINSYSGYSFYVCTTKPNKLSTIFAGSMPSNSAIVLTFGFFIKNFGYDYIVATPERKSAFYDGTKQGLGIVNGQNILEIVGINIFYYSGFPIDLTDNFLGNIRVSAYTIAILEDVINFGLFINYDDNSNAAQLAVQELSALKTDSYFYLAQYPAQCRVEDKISYKLETPYPKTIPETVSASNLSAFIVSKPVYYICETESYSDTYLYSSLSVLAIALPSLATICAFKRSAGNDILIAKALGNLVIGMTTIAISWVVNIVVDNMPSLSKYYINEFIESHENEGVYVVQFPAICAKDEDITHYAINIYLFPFRQWSLCGDKKIIEQYIVKNNPNTWLFFSNKNIIEMDVYGIYKGSENKDVFIACDFKGFPEFKVIIVDFNYKEDLLDLSRYKHITPDQLIFEDVLIKDNQAVSISYNDKNQNKIEIVSIMETEQASLMGNIIFDVAVE